MYQGSIHALKLRYDVLESHIACKRGADVDGAEEDGVEWEGGAAESDCRDLNCTLLRLMVVAYMAHMI